MALKFVISAPPEDASVEEAPAKPQASIMINARKTLDGNIMIFDHEDIDIVIYPMESKIVTFPKANFSDLIYDTQDRYFKFLTRKGVIIPESIKGGHVYVTMEDSFPSESDYANPLNVALFMTSEFVETEKPYMEAFQDVDEMDKDRILNPDEEDSTELGDVPHEETKGSLRPGYPGYYYGLAGNYRY